MRSLHYTTASIYSIDYKCYGFFAQDNINWQETSESTYNLIEKVSPHGLQPCLSLGDTDPRLDERERLSVLIEFSANKDWFLAATVAGLRSTQRRDFTGRPIRDGLHMMSLGNLEELDGLRESIQTLRGICKLYNDTKVTLDSWCSMEAFEQDRIPFPSAANIWTDLMSLGSEPLSNATPVERFLDASNKSLGPKNPDDKSILNLDFVLLIINKLSRIIVDHSIFSGFQNISNTYSETLHTTQRTKVGNYSNLRTMPNSEDILGIIETSLKQIEECELTYNLNLFRLGSRQPVPQLHFSNYQPSSRIVLQG